MPSRGPAPGARPRRPAVTERRARRREQYLEAITDAIRIYGGEQTMDQLAAAAGVSKPLLYDHFGDRAGLATALADRAARAGGHLAPPPNLDHPTPPAGTPAPAAAVLGACERFVRFAEADPHLYRWLLRVSHDGPAVLDPLLDCATWRDLLARTGVAGLDPDAVDVLTAGITGFVLAATDHWLTHPTMTRDALLRHLSVFLDHALDRPTGPTEGSVRSR